MSFFSTLIPAAASAIGGLFGADSQEDAAREQAKASRYAADTQERIAQQNREMLRPQIEAGNEARNRLLQATGLQGSGPQRAFFDDFQQDPGYQAATDYGQDQLASQMAARGMGYSGNMMQQAADYTGARMQNAYQSRINNLLSLANYGQQAAGNVASSNLQTGNQIAGYQQAEGNANAQGQAAWGNAFQNIGNSFASAFNTNNILDTYRQSRNQYGSPGGEVEAGTGNFAQPQGGSPWYSGIFY
jgi:hypothetical protein